MQLTHIKLEDYKSWQDYYWDYQYKLAQNYYIPLLKKWKIQLKGKKVLDIGCGNGGFTAGLADGGAICTGVDIKKFDWNVHNSNLRYIIQDITERDAVEKIGREYDLIILRDVIEHIPLDQKQQFLKSINRFSRGDSLALFTFPPFYSPFGLHQQTILKSFIRILPFLGWVPDPFLCSILKLFGEKEDAIDKIREIKSSRMTIRNFKHLLNQLKFVIEYELYFHIRPSHYIRYGWKTIISRTGKIPVINEIVNLGTVYLVKLNED